MTRNIAYPWQAQLEYGCGGTVIGREWVITAGHCFDNDNMDGLIDNVPVRVYLASRNVQVDSVDIFVHENYDPTDNNVHNDIALIKIPPIDCTNNEINAIRLLDESTHLEGCAAALVGRGTLWSDGPDVGDEDLLMAFSKAHTFIECNKKLIDDEINESQLCAFLEGDYTHDTCQGDSGGSLLIDSNPRAKRHSWVLAGIVSYGEGCGLNPGIYTRISHFKNWVLSKWPEAPFEKIYDCSRYVPAGQGFYISKEVHNHQDLTKCQIIYAGNEGYSLQCDDPHCLICGPDDTSRSACMFCKDGFDVDIPVPIENYSPQDQCAGICVPRDTAKHLQTDVLNRKHCKAHSCLTTPCKIGDQVTAVWYADGYPYEATIAKFLPSNKVYVDWADDDPSNRVVEMTEVIKNGLSCDKFLSPTTTQPPTSRPTKSRTTTSTSTPNCDHQYRFICSAKDRFSCAQDYCCTWTFNQGVAYCDMISVGSAMVVCKNLRKTPCVTALNCMWLDEEGEGECVDLNEVAVGCISNSDCSRGLLCVQGLCKYNHHFLSETRPTEAPYDPKSVRRRDSSIFFITGFGFITGFSLGFLFGEKRCHKRVFS